ncbi:MAG: ankyrin repeat domain-containing protein, partial [Alphaproteobacteria bacterium]|nr:ankyrin repeat domain-containing protein [Alphaproteobacteria bacterium]
DLLYQRTTQRGAWDSFRYSSGNPPQEQVLETPIQELSTTILQGIGSNGDVQVHMTSLGFQRDAQNPNKWVLNQNGERTSVILSDKRYERGENDQVIEIQDPSSLRIAEMIYEKPSAQASVTVQFYGDGASPQQTEVRVGSHSARETFYPDGQVSAHYETFYGDNCRIEYHPSGAPKYVGTDYWNVSYYDRGRSEEAASSNSPYGPIKMIDMGCGTPAQSGYGAIQMEFRPDGMPMTAMIRDFSTQKGHLVHLDEEGMMISHVPMIGQYSNNMQMHGVYEDWNGNKMTYVYGARFNGTPEEYDALVVQGQKRVREAIHAKNTAQIDRILAQVPGFSFNYIDPETKESPLMSAVRNGDQQMVTHLLRNGCNVNMEPASQQEGYTLMQAAIESGNASMVECLINNGVKVNGTKQGQAAMDMLASLPNPTVEHRGMQEILTRNGAVASRNNAQASAEPNQSVTAAFVAHHSSAQAEHSVQTATHDSPTAVSELQRQSESAEQPKNQAENSEARGDASARLRTAGNAVGVGANPLQGNGHQR